MSGTAHAGGFTQIMGKVSGDAKVFDDQCVGADEEVSTGVLEGSRY
jgi:hypothetical protein